MIIAHDLGTTADKASLHEDDGRMLGAVTIAYPADFRDGGIAEQDPRDWEHAVIEATRRLLRSTGADPRRVSGLVISGQMMGAVLLDEHREPVRPAIIWADTRAAEQAERIERLIGPERAYEILGHRVNPTYSLAKIMWVREHEPETWARVRHVCVAKDHVVERLTGVLATDRSDASATNAYDIRDGAWSAEVLAAAELEESLLPPILESTHAVGTLTAEAARSMGLPQGVRVVMGGGDGPIAAVGAGKVAPEDGAYVCLGTSSWISFAADAPVLDPERRTFTFEHVVPGRCVPTATMQASGASIAWVNEILSPEPSARSLHELVRAADTEDADTGGLYFLPYLLGERSPHWDMAARGAFVGIGRHHGRAHLMRAVLEGIAFNLAACLEAFTVTGHDIPAIDAVGGGAASDAWLQILADVWGIPVRRRTVVEEANSLGAAVVGAVGLGLSGFDAARHLSEVVAEFTPDPARTAAYRPRRERFSEAWSALAPWHQSPGRP